MEGAHCGAVTAEAAGELDQAAGVVRDDRLRAGRDDAGDLGVEDRYRNLRKLDGERAAEAAAVLGVPHLHELECGDGAEEAARLGAEAELAQQGTRVGG